MARTARPRTGLVAACCAAAGMLIAYLCDPDRGRARRARLSDQTRALMRRSRRRMQRRARYTAGHMVGVARKTMGAGRFEPADDVEIVQAIRQRFGRLGFPTTDVKVDVVDGTATLRGQLRDSQEIRRVEDAVMKVPGVRTVESFLHLPGQPAPNKAGSLSSVS